MAITYLSGERIQGLSTDTLETLTHEDDFSSDNYTHVSSGTDVTGGVFIFATSNDDQRGRKSLSVAMGSDDFLIDYDSNVGSGSLGHLYASLMLAENDTQPKANNTNDAYMVVTTGGGSSKMNVLLVERNGGSDNQSTANPLNVFNVNTVYFFRLTKEGTTLKIRGYATDSDRNTDTSVLGTVSLTLTGGFTNKLDVLQHGSWTNVNNVTGVTIDNLSIYNGVSSITSKPTNVPAGTRFEETDTRKIFRMKPVPTHTGFVDWGTDSSGDVVVANNVATVTLQDDNITLQGVSYDVGTANIGSTWTLQFIIDVTSYSTNSTCGYQDWGVWVRDNDSYNDHDNVGFIVSNTTCSTGQQLYSLRVANGGGYRGTIDADVSGQYEYIPTRSGSATGYTVPSATQGAASDGKLGVRLMRVSSTAFRLELWNNTDFSGSATVTLNTTDTTLCGNMTGLRHILISCYKQSGANGANNAVVSDLKFYNGSITNPPVASDPSWVEKGTA